MTAGVSLLHFFRLRWAENLEMRFVDAAAPEVRQSGVLQERHDGIRWRDMGWRCWSMVVEGDSLSAAWREDLNRPMAQTVVERWRVSIDAIDNSNWPGARPRPQVTDVIRHDAWRVVRKAQWTGAGTISCELTDAADIQSSVVPARGFSTTRCPWLYRGPECGYNGSGAWSFDGQPVSDRADDRCARTLAACRLRFPGNEIGFGGLLTER